MDELLSHFQTPSGARPHIQTPLGTIVFSAAVGPFRSDAAPARALSGPRLSTLFRWTTPVVEAQLLLCRPRLRLPEGMAVDDCWAALWRISALAETDTCAISASLVAGTDVEGSPSPGECLEAWEWSDGKTRVSLGTQDGAALQGRARMGADMPSRWSSRHALGCKDQDCLDLVHYTTAGLLVPLPSLAIGEQCQIHFVVAWAPAEPDNESTWFAVDLEQEHILDGARP